MLAFVTIKRIGAAHETRQSKENVARDAGGTRTALEMIAAEAVPS